MKTKSYFLLPVWIPLLGWGQLCGTPAPEHPFELGIEQSTSAVLNTHGPVCINVRFHIIHNSDGTEAFNLPNTDAILDRLNRIYNPHQIHFISAGENQINHNPYINLESQNEANSLLRSRYNVRNAINFFIVNALWRNSDDSETVGTTLGTLPTNSMVVGRNWVLTDTAVHEMGHCLGLYHTHETKFGREEIPRTGPQANCTRAGDLLCDTPADPELEIGGDEPNVENCVYTADDGYAPLVDNFMSYAPDECLDSFTAGQVERMHFSIQYSGALRYVVSESCGVRISGGEDVLCDSTPVFYRLNNLPPILDVEWSVSPQLRLGINGRTGLVVHAVNANLSEQAIIRGRLSNGYVFKKLLWMGVPKIDLQGGTFVGNPNWPFCVSRHWELQNSVFLPIEGEDEGSIEIQKLTHNFDYRLNGRFILIRPTSSGGLLFMFRASNGCGPTDWVPLQYMAIDCNRGGMWSIAPNPAQAYFQIEATDKDASYAQMLINYAVMDASGQSRLQGKIRAGSQIPIDQLPSGVYIVKIWAAKIEENHRLVIE